MKMYVNINLNNIKFHFIISTYLQRKKKREEAKFVQKNHMRFNKFTNLKQKHLSKHLYKDLPEECETSSLSN